MSQKKTKKGVTISGTGRRHKTARMNSWFKFQELLKRRTGKK